jgi:glycosyltransferase involved in cell wall biosynthesis
MKVSVITASVGNPHLAECIKSVREQTYKDVEHLVFVDGQERWGAANGILYDLNFPVGAERGSFSNEYVCVLPYATGVDRYNGHRVYGAATFIANGDFFIFLDEDNALEPNHIEKLVALVKEKDLDWAFSFRKIIDQEGKVICLDDCESLGKWASVLNPNDFFIDVNCYFVKKQVAIGMVPLWYRKFREPGQPEIDRVLASTLMHPNNKLKFDGTLDYTVKYRVGNTGLSVQADFFLNGNDIMTRRYNGVLPWKR